MSQQALSNLTTYTQPLVNADTSLVNAAQKGDYSQLIQASGSNIGTIDQQASQAKSNILSSMPAGPGRDVALAQIPGQTGNAIASTLNSTYQGALGQLAQLGGQFGNIGLQAAGGNLSGLQGGATTNVQLGQMQAAASPWNAVSSLVGAAGQAASGTNFKPSGGGSSGGGP